MTYELQKQHTAEDSAAGNWPAVAAALSAATQFRSGPEEWLGSRGGRRCCVRQQLLRTMSSGITANSKL